MGNSAGKDSDLPPGSIARTVHRRNLSTVSSTSPPRYRPGASHHRLSHIGSETSGLSSPTHHDYSSISLVSGSSGGSPGLYPPPSEPSNKSVRPPTPETVDHGSLRPFGVYSKPQDYNKHIVRQAIIDRRMAPFYKGLSEFDDSWTCPQLLTALQEPGVHTPDHFPISTSAPDSSDSDPLFHVYQGAVECPICFLYYPKYINFSRCCMQPICSECFVQIRRPDPHPADTSSPELPASSNSTSHALTLGESASSQLVSEPACCPYCQAPDFGITYIPSPFESGLKPSCSPRADYSGVTDPGLVARSRGPVSASDRLALLTDDIRPDWTAALAAARAYAARKAAAASAIHATAFMEHPPGSSARLSPRTRSQNRVSLNMASSRAQREAQHARELDDIMLAEAIRLSLKD